MKKVTSKDFWFVNGERRFAPGLLFFDHCVERAEELADDGYKRELFEFTQTRAHGPAHEVSTVNASSVTHDVNGNVTFMPVTVSTPARNLYWDFDNRMTGVEKPATAW